MHSPARSAVANMALDEAMLATAAEENAILVRLYTWDRPSISFGRNQRCSGIYSPERCAALGVPAVRRLTGGRALIHGRELTYAVAAPNGAAPSLRGGYDAINAMLLDALRYLGVAAEVAAPGARTASPGLAPCFEAPTAGELVVGTAKLVGSAQHRDARAFVQHGSILLGDDQGLLHELALVPLPAMPSPATLHEWLGDDMQVATVSAAVEQAVRRSSPGGIVVLSDDSIPRHHVETAASRYRDSRWTWRR
jgi:lipoyl(octanoyl) transferase